MKRPYLPTVMLLIIILFATSCSTMNWGQPAKSGPDTSANMEEHAGLDEKQGAKEEGGWLSRALPNFGYIWDKIPEPTEARRKWDERQNRGASSIRSQAEFYAP